MFQLVITRFSFMVPVLTVVGLGVFSFPFPSVWLLTALAAYHLMRAGGMGDSLPYRELERLDHAVAGGLIVLNGMYAIVCRGVAISGFVALVGLTTVFCRGYRAGERPGAIGWLIMSFAWSCVLYRWFHPVEVHMFGCLINNVG